MSESHSIIETRGLVKRYGRVRALDGLDLRVDEGEIHGFLGPNGSGKSTTMRVLLGQARPHGGTALVFGHDPWREPVAAHERLAYVPGDVTLWPGLTGGECIDILGRLQGTFSRRRRARLIERFDLDPTKRARTYSKGNRQKVALIAALATDAELLLLDEPTNGLDPLMEAEFQAVIREANTDGRTVLLSSHILAEVEALCHRVSIVRQGRIVTSATLPELRHHTLTTVAVTTAAPIPGLGDVPGITDLTEKSTGDGVHTHFRVGGAILGTAVGLVSRAEPTALTVAPPSLDEIFLDHYRDAS